MDIVKEARNKIVMVPKNTEFSLDDLFTGIEWNNFEKESRLVAGKIFLDLVKKQEIKGVELTKKSSANKQYYIKK